MDLAVPPELEELIICSCCHLPFNDTDCVPKLFTCRHYFCLKCVNSLQQEGSDELYCVHCWKRTTLQSPDGTPESLPTYNAILYLTQNLNTLSLKSQSAHRGGVSKQRSSSTTSTSSNGGSCNNNNGGGSGSSNNNNCNTNNNNGNGNGSLNNIISSGGGLTANGNAAACDMQSNSNKMNSKMGENCMTHAMPNTLWCSKCSMLVCRACSASEEHRTHAVKNQLEARETIQTDISNELLSMQKTLNDVQHLVLKQRDFLLKILESCTALKTQIETELINHIPTLEIGEMRESLGKAKLCLDMLDKQSPAEALKLYTTLRTEKQRLMAKYREMFLQCKLDDLIRNYGYIFDFDLIKQALMQLHSCVLNGGSLEDFGFGNGLGGAAGGHTDQATHHNPVLLLANYCISQLYSRQIVLFKQQQHLQHQQQQQQQQQKQQQQQQQQLHNNGNHATSSAMSLGLGISMNGVGGGSYAQALQSSAQQQQQNVGGPTSPPVVKTYADITTSSPKANQQLHHPSRHMLQQQPQSNNNFSDIGPIGTPLRCASNLFPCSSADLNGLGLGMFQIQQQQQQQQQHSQQQQKHSKSPTGVGGNMLLNPSVHVYPIYFFNIEINGQPSGRILIEVRNDVAPKMAKNFGALATHEMGFGYKGCHIFQCWDCESIITGDFELNNGRGGRSVYDEGYFMPDDTKIMAIRGSVGMRRSQKRHDNLGLVGSQFRVILREMRGFTGIFAFVVDGLELIEKISQFGDTTGKPQSSVVIVNCGKYHVG